MKKVFSNSSQVKCMFTDEGITFYGGQQEVFFPYGSLDYVNMSLFGILQAAHRSRICSFAADRKDRAEIRKLVKAAREAMKTAPKEEPRVVDLSKMDNSLVPADLPAEEQLKRYKELFVRGEISKEEYDARKRQLRDL